MPRRHPVRHLLTAIATSAALLAAGSSCTSPDEDVAVIRVGFLQDLTVASHVDLVSPSFLSFEQALTAATADLGAEVEVVQMDTEGDPDLAADLATEIANDPTYVAAVIAPFWQRPDEATRILADAGVPTLSLSPWARAPSVDTVAGGSDGLWRRLVADASVQDARLATSIEGLEARGPVCLLGDGSLYSTDVQAGVVEALSPTGAIAIRQANDMRTSLNQARAGCGAMVWTGTTDGAVAFSGSLRAADPAAVARFDLASDGLKTVFPPGQPGAPDVRVGSVTCPCVDVTTTSDLATASFINAYQSANGLPPGVYAAEGWDAGNMVAASLNDGAADRGEVRLFLESMRGWEGAAGSLRFDDRGELIDAPAGLFRAAGTRWLAS